MISISYHISEGNRRMITFIRTLLLSAVVGLSLVTLAPSPAQGDDYWNGYWSWYDNTYRPYYYKQYYYGPGYSVRSYSNYYYSPAYPGYTYAPGYGPYYGPYYGTPRVGYAPGPYGGGTVRVGPMRFGWR